MSFDSATLHQLQYQGRRMHHVLHETTPPDRKEALAIQQRVDDILDRRPQVHSVASDGEVVFDDQSSWVLGQTVAVNATSEPEVVLPPEGGGVGLLDRPPAPETRLQPHPLTREEEAQVARWGHVLGSLPESEEPK